MPHAQYMHHASIMILNNTWYHTIINISIFRSWEQMSQSWGLRAKFEDFVWKNCTKMFPKITRMYKYFFSKCSKWAHFQFGGSFYEYLQLQGAFFENFDFLAISGRSKVKISWFFQFFAKFWPLIGHKWPKNQNFQKRLLEVVDIHKNFLQTENGPI